MLTLTSLTIKSKFTDHKNPNLNPNFNLNLNPNLNINLNLNLNLNLHLNQNLNRGSAQYSTSEKFSILSFRNKINIVLLFLAVF